MTGIAGPKEAIAIVFFVVFVIIAALVLLSMFIGIVTTAMFTATAQYEEAAAADQLDKDKAAAAIKLAKLMESDEMKNTIWAISGEKLSAEELGMGGDGNTSGGCMGAYMSLSELMYRIANGSLFGTTMLLIILLASALVGISAGGWARLSHDARQLHWTHNLDS